MTEYTCKRCEFNTQFKHSLQRHLKKKTPCTVTKEDVPRENLLLELSQKEYTGKEKFVCMYCDKRFSHRSTKSHHMSTCRSKSDINESLLKRIEKLEKYQFKSENIQHIHNHLNNHGTFIINNNCTLRNFGEENKMAIPLDLIRSCFMNLEFNTMFENLHCDPDYPENHNVRIKSFKRELLEIYKNNKWNSLCFSDGFREVIQQIYIIFKEYTKHHIDLLNEDMNDEEIEENEKKLERIFEWIKDTQSKLRHIKEVKQITAVLDTQRDV